MQLPYAFSLVATTLALLVLPACSSRLGPRIAGGHGYEAAASGSASYGDGHQGHDHKGDASHEREHGQRPGSPLHAGHQPHTNDLGRHGHGDAHARPRLLRTDLRRGWCEPPSHYHASALDTPFVHGFLTEPAFLGRDLFVDVARSDNGTEVEAEVEWSLTRRLGLIVELPYIDGDESGIGDAALGLRALLVEQRRFLLSASTEVELPTGSERRGLGSGAVAVGANVHTWTDLGSWFTLQTVTGVEYVPEDGGSGFTWSVALAKSFRACPLMRSSVLGRPIGGHEHDLGPRAFSLIAEVQGVTDIAGSTGTEGRWLLGVSYPLADRLDLRGAFSRSFGGDEVEEAWSLGFIFHL